MKKRINIQGLAYIKEGEHAGKKVKGTYRCDGEAYGTFTFDENGKKHSVSSKDTLPLSYGKGLYKGQFLNAEKGYNS